MEDNILIEATGADTSVFPTVGDETLDGFVDNLNNGVSVSIDDDRWNELFERYLRANYHYYYIKASEVPEKMAKGKGVQEGEPAYLSLKEDAATVQKRGIIFWKKTDRIELNAIKWVVREEATAFTSEDADTVVAALKRHRVAMRGITFTKEAVKLGDTSDISRKLFELYFNKAAGFSNASDRLRNALPQLYSICRTLKHPLAGNTFLRIFSDACKNELLRGVLGQINNNTVLLFNNLIADRELSSSELRNPQNSFETLLMFNKDINKKRSAEVRDLLRLYDKAVRESWVSRLNKKEIKQKILPHLILKDPAESEQEDFVEKALTDISNLNVDDFVPLDENAILTWDLRPESQIIELMNKVLTTTKTPRSEYSVWFTVKNKSAIKGKLISYEDDTVEAIIAFKDQPLETGDEIALVIAKGEEYAGVTPLSLTAVYKDEIADIFKLGANGKTLTSKQAFSDALQVALELTSRGWICRELQIKAGRKNPPISARKKPSEEGQQAEEGSSTELKPSAAKTSRPNAERIYRSFINLLDDSDRLQGIGIDYSTKQPQLNQVKNILKDLFPNK